MAVTKTNIITTQAIADLQTALTAAGLLTETKYINSEYLIFTTPLTSKVIKVYYRNGSFTSFQVYYGDAWTSTSTITNPVGVSYLDSAVDNGWGNITLITGTNFFMLLVGGLPAFSSTELFYLGELDNGDEITFGAGTGFGANNQGINLTTGEIINPITLATNGFKNSGGALFTMPLMFCKADGTILLNGTAIAVAAGVKVSSVTFTGTYVVYHGTGFMLTPATMYINSATKSYITTALLVEHD